MIRVFPRRTAWTPVDRLAYTGYPLPLELEMAPRGLPICVSVAFSFDIEHGYRLADIWSKYASDVQVGGPAFGPAKGSFTPNLFIRDDIGVTFTTRGCGGGCWYCNEKDEQIVEIKNFHDGNIIQDNNIFSPSVSEGHLIKVFDMCRRQKAKIQFKGGVDVRHFNQSHIDLLKTIRLESLWFAYDEPWQLDPLIDAAILMHGQVGVGKRRVYVLVGYEGDTFAAAEERCMTMLRLGYLPYAMRYISPEGWMAKPVEEWGRFQRSWIRPAIYRRKLK